MLDQSSVLKEKLEGGELEIVSAQYNLDTGAVEFF